VSDYINSKDNEIPDNTILVVPHVLDSDGDYLEIIESLVGNKKRDWFTDHFYYCLPLVTGNQYGFIVKAAFSFTAVWAGGENPVVICYGEDYNDKQIINDHFKNGIITVQNRFALKTPPNINLMTVQPSNYYISNLVAMNAVVETDNLRRDFTFNLRVMSPDTPVVVKAGDPLAGFIPIPRGTVEKYQLRLITDIFTRDQHALEVNESNTLGVERETKDKIKPHAAGRRYFKGTHTNNSVYQNHQKTLKGNEITDIIGSK